mgnify:CR=1 FL=1
MNGLGINKFKTNPVTDKLRSGQPAVPAQTSPVAPAWQRWNDYGIGCFLEGGGKREGGNVLRIFHGVSVPTGRRNATARVVIQLKDLTGWEPAGRLPEQSDRGAIRSDQIRYDTSSAAGCR